MTTVSEHSVRHEKFGRSYVESARVEIETESTTKTS